MPFSMSGIEPIIPNANPVFTPKYKEVLGQGLSPDELKDIPSVLNRTKMGGGNYGRNYVEPYVQVNPEYQQYAVGEMGNKSNSGRILGYRIPTGKTYQGKPLIAEYDAQGNFEYATITPDQFLQPDPNRPNIISQPKFNKTGGIVDYGIGDTSRSGGNGIGEFLGSFISDVGPMILAGLGANYLPGLLGGGSAAAGGAGAAAGGNAGALINAGMGGTAAQAASAASNLAATSAGLEAAIAAGGGLVPGVTANFMSPSVISGAGGATPAANLGLTAGGQDIAQLQQQLANTPMPEVTSGPPIAGEAVPGSLPEIAAGNADKAALYGAEGYGAAATPAELAAAAAGGTGLLSSLGDVGSAIMQFAKDNPSIAGSLIGAVTSAVGSSNAPKSTTTTASIDPELKAEYLANIARAKETAAGLGVRQFAEPSAMYTGAENKLYNLGMTPFGEADIARFYNPYQEQVVQGALGDIERTRQIQEQANMANATAARAFGGSRQGVVSGLTNEAALRQAATTGANLRATGFNTAADLGFRARTTDTSGLKTAMELGTARTALEQARLDALRNLGTERLGITGGALGLGIPNLGGSTSQPLYSNTAGSALSGGLTGAYIGSLLQPKQPT
jgi:hypothetical protein